MHGQMNVKQTAVFVTFCTLRDCKRASAGGLHSIVQWQSCLHADSAKKIWTRLYPYWCYSKILIHIISFLYMFSDCLQSDSYLH